MGQGNMKKAMGVFWLAIIGLLVAGCNTPTLTVTATPIQPSETVEPSPVPLPSATTTIKTTPTVSVASACIPIEENLPEDLKLSGVWLRGQATPYFENLDDHADYLVPLEGGGLIGYMALSPNGKYLAYIDTYYNPDNKYRPEKKILRVIHSSGHSLQMDYWTEDWQSIIGWVDDEHLALFTSQQGITILNPFTGEWKKFKEPEWIRQQEFPAWAPSWQHYSPDLSKVVIEKSDGEVTIQDGQSGETIFSATGNYYKTIWSESGSVLAISPNDGHTLYVLKKGNLAFQLRARELPSSVSSIENLKVSPNGAYIAFNSYQTDNLYFLDIAQMKVNLLCTQEYRVWSWQSPIWSPDGRFIIQEIYNSSYEAFDVLVDIQEMRAYKLISGKYQHRLAWLASP